MIGALHPSCGFAGRLDSGQKKGDEHSDNRNDDEQFDKGESVLVRAAIRRLRMT
jgi:hypothetical protein